MLPDVFKDQVFGGVVSVGYFFILNTGFSKVQNDSYWYSVETMKGGSSSPASSDTKESISLSTETVSTSSVILSFSVSSAASVSKFGRAPSISNCLRLTPIEG